jgi:hypothetical protein
MNTQLVTLSHHKVFHTYLSSSADKSTIIIIIIIIIIIHMNSEGSDCQRWFPESQDALVHSTVTTA